MGNELLLKCSPDKNQGLFTIDSIYHVKYSVRNGNDKLKRFQCESNTVTKPNLVSSQPYPYMPVLNSTRTQRSIPVKGLPDENFVEHCAYSYNECTESISPERGRISKLYVKELPASFSKYDLIPKLYEQGRESM